MSVLDTGINGMIIKMDIKEIGLKDVVSKK
jgi:hypothetical protein